MQLDKPILLLVAAVLLVTAPAAAQADAVSIDADSQPTQGENVTIRDATIDQDGWVVIHPEGDQFSPNGGEVYGKRYLEAGSHENVTVNLSTTLLLNQSLFAMLHYDDPADEEFTFPNDPSEDPPVEQTQPFESGERTFEGNVSVDHFYIVIAPDNEQNRLIAEREALEFEEDRREELKSRLEEENQQLQQDDQDDDGSTADNDSEDTGGDEEEQPGFALVGALAALIAAAAVLRRR